MTANEDQEVWRNESLVISVTVYLMHLLARYTTLFLLGFLHVYRCIILSFIYMLTIWRRFWTEKVSSQAAVYLNVSPLFE